MSATDITRATTPGDIEAARQLIREYVASLNVSLTFQDCEQEVASLPGKYASPKGCLLLAKVDGCAAGCVALRPLEEGICEMKRLYVRPEFRGRNLGRKLAEEIIAAGRKAGYRVMRLDTLDTLKPAMALYKALGFYEIPAYYPNPITNVVYLELKF